MKHTWTIVEVKKVPPSHVAGGETYGYDMKFRREDTGHMTLVNMPRSFGKRIKNYFDVWFDKSLEGKTFESYEGYIEMALDSLLKDQPEKAEKEETMSQSRLVILAVLLVLDTIGFVATIMQDPVWPWILAISLVATIIAVSPFLGKFFRWAFGWFFGRR